MIPFFGLIYWVIAFDGVNGSGPLIWILGAVSSFYGLVFPPFFLLSLANMVFHNDKLEEALSFK